MVIITMTEKIFITSPNYGKNTPQALSMLSGAGLQVLFSTLNRGHSEKELLDMAVGCAAILVFNSKDEVNEHVIDGIPELRVLSRHGIGMDNISVDHAKGKGIAVKNTIFAHEEEAVADLAVALILCASRGILEMSSKLRCGVWMRKEMPGLTGKTVGVVGLGRIGRSVVERLKGFKVKIAGYDPFVDELYAHSLGIELLPLEQLLRCSDFVTLHVPLTSGTARIIGEKELAVMQPGSWLINTSRAGLIDSDALFSALKNNEIQGAALDVFEKEPAINDRFTDLENVIATPHIAGITKEIIHSLDLEAAANIIDVLAPNYDYSSFFVRN